MQIHHYHPTTGEYLGTGTADESPLEPGVFLIPGGAVNAEPPVVEPGKRYKWNGEQFVAEDKVVSHSSPQENLMRSNQPLLPLSIRSRESRLKSTTSGKRGRKSIRSCRQCGLRYIAVRHNAEVRRCLRSRTIWSTVLAPTKRGVY